MTLQRGHSKAQQPEVSDFRALSRADLAVLAEKRPTKTLQTLRDSHHRIARAIAAGLSNQDVALFCGVSQSRVSQYKRDPAFAELIAHYRGVVTAEYVQSVDSFMEVATSNMLKAAVMISDKLDAAMDTGETLPMTQLIALQADGADRFGYGKMQKNLNVNVDFAAQLEGARRRTREAKVDPLPTTRRTIDASPSPAPINANSRALSPSPPPRVGPAPALTSPVQGPTILRRL